MAKGAISKKDSSEDRIVNQASDSELSDIHQSMYLAKILAEGGHLTPTRRRAAIYFAVAHFFAREKSENAREELTQAFYSALAPSLYPRWYRTGVERRLKQLESLTSIHNLVLERLEARTALPKAEEQEEEQQWPAFASGEFAELDENRKGIEESGDDKELILYHIMEIETLLGKVERKARATNREYEARLAASLRDICRIHEPSELSNEQIECFTGSLQALTEGWGELTKEKVKWIRGRLLEVGLTWLPVTQKAQMVIDEAKSSVR